MAVSGPAVIFVKLISIVLVQRVAHVHAGIPVLQNAAPFVVRSEKSRASTSWGFTFVTASHRSYSLGFLASHMKVFGKQLWQRTMAATVVPSSGHQRRSDPLTYSPNKQQATSNKQQATSNKQHATCNKQSTLSTNPQPTTNKEK